jgi:hydroxymethylglutaryl-CoA reductase
VSRAGTLTVIVLAIAMVVGGLLTTQHVLAVTMPSLILTIIGGLALLGAAFLVIAGLGLRARRNPGKVILVVAPKARK